MSTVPATLLAFVSQRMLLTQKDIARCVAQLSESELWQRGGDHENSISNLLLHLAGNMHQWILHGVDNQPDVRLRDEEFTLTPTLTSAEAHSRFNQTLEETASVIASLDPERLLTVINPQPTGSWPPCTILEAILHVSGHLQLHAGQIILLTKRFVRHDLDLSMPRKR